MANNWASLMRLLPTTDKTVGKILSINSTLNTAVLASLGGGDFTANIGKGSTYVVGNWVLVRDNIIVSTIPVPQGEGTPEVAKDVAIF